MTSFRDHLRRRPAPATVIASIALFVAVGGPAEAARLISGKDIRNSSVTGKDLKDRSVKTRDLSVGTRSSLRKTPSGSVGTAQLRDGAVGAAQLQPGGVTAAALALNSVGSGTVLDKSIGGADLADNAVTSEKIAANHVRKPDIAGGAVGRSELGAGSVSTGEVEDGALVAADVADAFGEVRATFGSVDQFTCEPSVPLAVPTVKAGETLVDDAIVVTPPAAWPAAYTVSAKPAGAAAPGSVVLTVCNVGDAAAVALPETGFRILGIDQ